MSEELSISPDLRHSKSYKKRPASDQHESTGSSMHALRTSLLVSLLTSAIACQRDDDPLPPVQVEGRFLSYAADEDIVVCDGTVEYAEAWMEALALYLGMDPDAILPTTYYFVDPPLLDEVCGWNWGGCTHRVDG